MASLNDLRRAVTALLSVPGIRPVLQLNSNTRERAFEAYVFSLVLKGLRQAGAAVQLVGIQSGVDPTRWVFRGSPGQMSSTAQDFLYAECSLEDRSFEVHVDVQYEGSSGATHEIDVSIYDHRRADAVRRHNALPGSNYLYGAVECKFYDSTLGTSLGRAFVGLVDDCGALVLKSFATNGKSDGLRKYFRQKRRPDPFFTLSPLRPKTVTRFLNKVDHDFRKGGLECRDIRQSGVQL